VELPSVEAKGRWKDGGGCHVGDDRRIPGRGCRLASQLVAAAFPRTCRQAPRHHGRRRAATARPSGAQPTGAGGFNLSRRTLTVTGPSPEHPSIYFKVKASSIRTVTGTGCPSRIPGLNRQRRIARIRLDASSRLRVKRVDSNFSAEE
jgi:hypothetical protein